MSFRDRTQKSLMYDMCNEPIEITAMLKDLNVTIRTLQALGDEYYTDYIFNEPSVSNDGLKKIGFTNKKMEEIADLLEQFRSIVFGVSVIDWDQLYYDLLEDCLAERENDSKKYDSLRKEHNKLYHTVEKTSILKYKNLTKWLQDHGTTWQEFSKENKISFPQQYLVGHYESRSDDINKILEITGMTYEECFKED